MKKHRIQIVNRSNRRLRTSIIKEALTKMLEAESQPPSEISVLLTDDEEIRELNLRFRKIDSATDVLSFPAIDGDGFLGDIAISIPQAERQAEHHLNDLATELCCLAVHGGLHLLGYDHQTDDAEQEMHSRMNAAVIAAGMMPKENWASLPH